MAYILLAKTKRGTLESRVYQEANKYYIEVWALTGKEEKKLREGGTVYFDQDEAEMEASVLLDAVWRESAGKVSDRVRRI